LKKKKTALGNSLCVHLQTSKLPETAEFAPTIEPRSKKSQHPEVAVLPQPAEAATLSQNVPAHSPAIPQRIKESPFDM